MAEKKIQLDEQLIRLVLQDTIDFLHPIADEGSQDCQCMIDNLQAILPYAKKLVSFIVTREQLEQLLKVYGYLGDVFTYLKESNAPEEDTQDCYCQLVEVCILLYWLDMPMDEHTASEMVKIFAGVMKKRSIERGRQTSTPSSSPSTSSSPSSATSPSSPTVTQDSANPLEKELRTLEKELGEHLPHITITGFSQDKDYEAELKRLTGLGSVKKSLTEHIGNYLMLKERQALHPDIHQQLSFNTIFKGRPGTGKTTVARLLAGIMRNKGIIPSGHLVEVDATTLINPYIGVSAKIAKYVALKAVGGILFIDEAYALNGGKGKHSDAGKDVIDALTPIFENYRDRLVVILAGYNKEMDEMLSQVNTGFASRFRQSITFEDYNAEEMLTIFMGMAARDHYQLSDEAIATLCGVFDLLYRKRNNVRGFANARTIRSIYETICSKASNRMLRNELSGLNLDKITIEDVRLTPQELRAAMGIL